MSGSRARRGQAAVELALGLTLLVPLALAAFAFAESGQVSLKVAEAADSALWDGTADRRPAVGDAYARAAGDRYADFDGRSSTSGTRTRTEVATRSAGFTLECHTTTVAITQPALVERVMPATAARSCTARALTELFGGFTRAHCSAGRPDGIAGPCHAEQGLALDDGSLLDHRDCPVAVNGGGCENREYFGKVRALVTASGPPDGAPLALVAAALRATPPHADTALDTYLSFRGEDAPRPFEQAVPFPGDGEYPQWQTTPYEYHSMYRDSFRRRTDCHLGAACAGGSLDDP